MAGRKKKTEVPESVKELIHLAVPELTEAVLILQEEIQHEEDSKERSKVKWDVPITEKILFFDPTLSYELSGYRPIDEVRGLDFNPEWFTEAKQTKINTGRYCPYPAGTKKYVDFWKEEIRKCNEGMWAHGYRLTGDNYFFLNYYRLNDVKVEKAAAGREVGFPDFFSKQYEYFHYIDLCERSGHDVCALKSRGVGQH